MKSLKVTSISPYGEQTVSHPLSEVVPQDAMIVATLQGVVNAGHAIKSFEIVEA